MSRLDQLVAKKKIKQEVFNASIKKKLIITFITLSTLPFILLCIIYTVLSKSALRTTSTTVNSEVVSQIANSLNGSINSVEEGMMGLTRQSLLNTGYMDELVSKNAQIKGKANLQVTPLLSAFKTSQGYITGTCITFLDTKEVVGTVRGYDATTLLEASKELDKSKFQWITPKEVTRDSVLVGKAFNDTKQQAEFCLVSKFQLSPVQNYFSKVHLVEGSVVYLLDGENTLLVATDEQLTEVPNSITSKLTVNSEVAHFSTSDALIIYCTLKNGWQLVAQIPYASLTEHLDRTLPVIILLFIVICMLVAVIGYFYASYFSKPIINLMRLMEKAEKGNLTVQAEVGSKDEMGALCQSFNHMIQNINKLIEETKEVALHVTESSKILMKASSHSEDAISELVIASSDIAEGTTIQASEAKRSTEHMKVLAEAMDRVDNKAMVLLDNTKGAQSMIQNATTTIQSLSDTMEASLKITDQISRSISELNGLNQNIENIMGLVDNISQETNLLALNASIEAARVGEAGKGFAVVANEVRKLSDQSKVSTLNVRDTLTTINDKMGETVTLAERSKHMMEDQGQVVREAYELFTRIIGILGDMLNALKDIGGSVEEMRKLKESMVAQIQNIASVSQEAAASTEEVSTLATEEQNTMRQFAALSAELARKMEVLHQSIDAFKI